jgi:integrase
MLGLCHGPAIFTGYIVLSSNRQGEDMAKVIRRTWVTAQGEQKEAWIVRYYQNGKQHIKTHARKKDAEAYMHEVGVGIRNRTHVAPSQSITIAEAADRWLAASEAAGLEPTTIEFYRAHVSHHIKPVIGATKLTDFTSASVGNFAEKLRNADRSPVQIGKVMVSLGSILAEAVSDGLLTRNVVRERSRSKGRRKHIAKRLKPVVEAGRDMPTVEEMKVILEAAPPRWRMFLTLAAFTGMRVSELRGLRWEDVSFEESTITVRQRADKNGTIGLPKSGAGRRTISIGARIVMALKEWKLKSGGGELVFPSQGQYHNSNKVLALSSIIRLGLVPAVLRAGLKTKDGEPKYSGMHCLRHFHASWCINPPSRGGLGMTAKEVQARLGHASITVTMNTYGHLFPRGDDSKAMAAAEAALLG